MWAFNLLQKWKCYLLSYVLLSLTAWTVAPTSLLCPWNSPGKNTGVGIHSFLQGIFLTQGSNPGFLHCRQIFYCLSHQGRVSLLQRECSKVVNSCHSPLASHCIWRKKKKENKIPYWDLQGSRGSRFASVFFTLHQSQSFLLCLEQVRLIPAPMPLCLHVTLSGTFSLLFFPRLICHLLRVSQPLINKNNSYSPLVIFYYITSCFNL